MAHLEHFKSETGVLKEKSALLVHTEKLGCIPATYEQALKSDPNLKGKLDKVQYVPDDYFMEGGAVTFFNGIKLQNPKINGKNNFSNMNLILRVLEGAGLMVNKQKIGEILNHLNCFPGRGNRVIIERPDFNINIVCQYHNSNPHSFISTINNIREPSVVIMGYFYELGEATEKETHRVLQIMENNNYIFKVFFGDEKLWKIPNIDKYKKIVAPELSLVDILNMAFKQRVYGLCLKGGRASKLETYLEKIISTFAI